jgi:HAD superfamily hydrolase (TIGR01458 family)
MRIGGVLLDIGGVVHVGERVLPGAVEAIARLRAAGVAIRFLTNSTRSPHRRILATLRGMGVEVATEELFTPAMAARRMLEREGLGPHLLVHPALAEDFADIQPGEDAVVIGDAGDAFTYAALNAAYRLLDGGAAFLALANNRSFRDADGGLSLDTGPFVAALSFASGREPEVLGKPAPAFFRMALAAMGCDPGEAAMIGDDAEADVGGALACGIAGVLVRTGKYVPGAEAGIAPPPNAVVDDLAVAVDWILAGLPD